MEGSLLALREARGLSRAQPGAEVGGSRQWSNAIARGRLRAFPAPSHCHACFFGRAVEEALHP